MKYLKLFAVFGALALVGAGSATLLDVFGTVSGTADVKPALKVSEVDYEGSDEAVEIYNPSDGNVDLTNYNIHYDDQVKVLTAINQSSTIYSEGLAVIVESDYSGDYSEEYNGENVNYFEVDRMSLTEGGSSVGLLTTGSSSLVIDNVSYSSSCNPETESYHRTSVQDSNLDCDTPSIGSSTKLGGGN